MRKTKNREEKLVTCDDCGFETYDTAFNRNWCLNCGENVGTGKIYTAEQPHPKKDGEE
jgi:hypothetical protein